MEPRPCLTHAYLNMTTSKLYTYVHMLSGYILYNPACKKFNHNIIYYRTYKKHFLTIT